GKELVKAAWGAAVWLTDANTGRVLRTFPVPGGGDAALVHFAFAGKALVAADTRGKVHIFDAATAKALHSLKAGVYSRASCVAASPDGKLFAVAAGYPAVSLRVSDTDTDRERETHTYAAWAEAVGVAPVRKLS